MTEKHPLLKRFFLVAGLVCMGFASQAADVDKTPVAEQLIDINDVAALNGFCAPVQGKVISHFGYRGRHLHAGTDIKLKHGDTIRAAFDGVVTKACRYSGYGNLVIVKHPNNIETYYSHLSKCIVANGDSVKAGQLVGLAGRTGRASTDHLHFEVRFNRIAKNPEKYFDFKNNEVKDLMKDKLLSYTLVVKADKPVALVPVTSELPTSVEASNEVVATTDDCVHVIRKGDTLYALSRHYGTTVKQLQEWNSLESNNLRIGLKLKVK